MTCVSVRYEMQMNEDIWLTKSSMLKVMSQPLSQTFKKREGHNRSEAAHRPSPRTFRRFWWATYTARTEKQFNQNLM